MPDTDFVDPQLPPDPALNLSPNESLPPASASAETPVAEKILSAGEKIFEKFALPFKRGRGRPRKDGQPKGNDVPLAPAAAGTPPVAPVAAAAVDSRYGALFSRSIGSAVRGVLDFAKKLVRKKAGQAGIDKDFTEKALIECEVEPAVMADFNESLQIVLEKYRVNTEYAPEIALAIATGRMAAPYVMLLKTFDDEIKRKKSAEKSTAK